MKNYKDEILKIVQEKRKEFFSVERSEEATKFAESVFTKFIDGLNQDSDNGLMFQFLKILAVEGVMENGFRSENEADFDA